MAAAAKFVQNPVVVLNGVKPIRRVLSRAARKVKDGNFPWNGAVGFFVVVNIMADFLLHYDHVMEKFSYLAYCMIEKKYVHT